MVNKPIPIRFGALEADIRQFAEAEQMPFNDVVKLGCELLMKRGCVIKWHKRK